MTTKRRFPLALAEVTAQSLLDLLAPACQRIEVAGSVRRGRQDVGDIELLCVPRFEVQRDLFGQPVERVSLLDRRCLELIRSGHLDYRPNKAGALTFGPMNKLLLHQGTGIPVDVFTATAENWGMFLFVRTGPAGFIRQAMGRFRALGMAGHAYGGVTTASGEVVNCPAEEDVFNLLGWDWLPPEARRDSFYQEKQSWARVAAARTEREGPDGDSPSA